MNEVAILTCSRSNKTRPFVQKCLTLPLPSLGLAKSKYIADTTFNTDGSQIAAVTDHGFWSIFDVSVRRATASVVASGWIELPELSAGETRSGWWKMEWIDRTNDLLIAESKGLHLLNLNVTSALIGPS
jgi:hypothetical protein